MRPDNNAGWLAGQKREGRWRGVGTRQQGGGRLRRHVDQDALGQHQRGRGGVQTPRLHGGLDAANSMNAMEAQTTQGTPLSGQRAGSQWGSRAPNTGPKIRGRVVAGRSLARWATLRQR